MLLLLPGKIYFHPRCVEFRKVEITNKIAEDKSYPSSETVVVVLGSKFTYLFMSLDS